ncbi:MULTISPECIES: oligopeptide ABC transporter permease [Geobacillus]|jgi:oligopeptide transport system permease protein|uniref:Oligopeptide transport system permease protein OppB n=2 Tax=Geobacillus thermodenitrificans TaxID=33940 RepID=A4IL68_GEOTN|nr:MULTISPECIES: oligopeptide ABC transporter permease [Geobacillus]ABO66072.1 Oligopeptide transport system permease protein OppB [Geobacillus thermodenitrificans NG80-2]ARA97493.1 peptide ABC transporter permease [Geobacillus thermodenitrificans]ARP41804.1 Dipeptide transport system permease protein DppB [Geobacillus thermodenitrificans]ATO36818.1 peptide ABC transporter permease [Geobacillus thermodenitrificans]KQB94403.1 Oligopeptide transport system permease protein OppB [Geobacillus sp. 
MARYTIQRIVYMVITLFIIATLTFFLMKLLPGSPLQNQEKLTPEQRALILKEYGLDKPVPVQYVQYLGNLLQGDLGVSFQYDNRPVTELIGDRIGPSAQLGFQAIVFGTIVGLVLGIFAAIRHNSWEDYTATVIAVIGISVPSFVLAGFLQYFIGVKLQWLPVAFWEGFKYTIMPTLALSVGVIANIARFMRTEMLEVLSSDYILTARAKGISNAGVVVKHAIRNSLIPVITILGPMAVNLMTGTLVIEKIFAVPGLGEQFVRSIELNDYPVIMGTTLFYSALLIFVIFIVDILYGIVDPRIRLAGGKK